MTRPETSARRFALFLLPFLVGACQAQELGTPAGDDGSSSPAVAEALASVSGEKLVDLTHPFSERTIIWPTGEPFQIDTLAQGMTEAGYFYAAYHFSGPEHGGTHLDAPWHFAEEGWTSDRIPLERLMGPAAVIDVSEASAADPDYQFTVEDVTRWEAEHGRLPDGAIVLFFTDRARFWPDAEAYMGTAERGPDAVADLHFPGIHPDLARWLVENRSVAAVGLDTPSIDYGQSTDFMSHRILYEANVLGFENVASLERLPPVGASVIALPVKIEGGSGGPLRIVGVLPD